MSCQTRTCNATDGFNAVLSGGIATKPCPSNWTGVVLRKCGVDGTFEAPNYAGCQGARMQLLHFLISVVCFC